MRILKICLLAWLLTSVVGCQWFHRTVGDIGETYNTNPVVNYPDEKNPQPNTQFPPPIDLDCYTFPGDAKMTGNPCPASSNTAYAKAALANDTGMMARNRFMAILMERSDRICAIMKSDIAGLNDTVNFSLGEITTVLGGVGAIVTGAGAARALAGSAAITNASRAQFNEVFYQNAIKTAILRAIDSSRQVRANNLTAHTKDTVADYPVDAMIRDVNAYNDACSFYNGVAALAHPSDVVPDSAADISARIAVLQQQITADQTSIDALKQKQTGAPASQAKSLQSQIDNLERAKEVATSAIANLTAQLTLLRSNAASGKGTP